MRLAVCAAFPFPYPQGSQVYVREQLRALAAAGAKPTLVCYGRGEGEAPADLDVRPIPRRWSPRRLRSGFSAGRPVADLALVRALVAEQRRARPAATLAHNAEGALAALAARALTGVPVVYVAHTLLREELAAYGPPAAAGTLDRIGAALDALLARRADAVVALSERARSVLVQHARGPVVVVPPGFARSALAPGDANIRAACERAGVAVGGFAVYAGNLDRYQDLARLGALAARSPEPVLAVTHDPEGALPPGVRVVAARSADEVRALVHGAALALAPRRRAAGFPVKLLHYMEAARPIVASAGAAGGLVHDVSALLVPVAAPADGFADAALALRADPERAERLGAGARAQLAAAHAPADLAARLLALVEAVVGVEPATLPA